MEACKKIPYMISFELKNSPEATSFHNLKQCIAEYYGENPDSYSKEFRELEELRGLSTRPRTDMECCATMKRYYSQLHSLQNRFPLSSDTDLLSFVWKDIYSGSVWSTSNIRYEMAATLYNIAVLHTKLGVEEERGDPESMKLACTYFQCAAWAFGEIKNQYGLLLRSDMSAELLIYMQQICFAQAQECILEKSLADNRKSAIIAKVTAQVISFYNAAMSALFSQNEDGTIQDLIGNKLYKEWLKYIKFKTSYLSSVLFLYQGQNCEEQRKMGERVALYNAACDRLEEAKKEVKGMNRADAINETLSLATDIIEGKRKNAKQENEFIYHEAIPDLSSISAVQGANLVQGISFDVTDSQVIGEDIFKRLVPMKTHENLSLYSEEKANILRQLGAKIDERDTELASFMGSLNLDLLNAMKQSQERLPQNLVDRCAELSAKPNAIFDLVESMSNLANICTEVEASLNEIKHILDEESVQEQNFQKQMGKRPTGHMTELSREFTKYFDAHTKAGESNDTLRKAMELHVSNLKVLAQPLSVLKDQVPQSEAIDEEVRKELENLLNKVDEMKAQRDTIFEELRDQILNKDDITSQLVAYGDKDVDELFKKELKKYSQSVNIIEQNLVAQGNILKALMDTYAKHALKLKSFNDVKSKREQFFSGLIGSFDVYEDLMSKSTKGVDFYKKLHGNIQKLLSRVKAARDVQEEERQQLLKNAMAKSQQHMESVKSDNIHKTSLQSNIMATISNSNTVSHTPSATSGLKLKDYIKSGMVPNIGNLRDDAKVPAVRPSPVGQETIPPTHLTSCSSVNYPTNSNNLYTSQYYQQQQQMYQNQQQHPQQYYQTQNFQNPTADNKMTTPISSNSNYKSNVPSGGIYRQTPTMPSGYTNPMYQASNQMYQDMNAYNQLNYNNQYIQQQQQHQLPKSSVAPASSSINYQGYYNQQQISPNPIMSQQNHVSQNSQQQQPIQQHSSISSQNQQQLAQNLNSAMPQQLAQNPDTLASQQQQQISQNQSSITQNSQIMRNQNSNLPQQINQNSMIPQQQQQINQNSIIPQQQPIQNQQQIPPMTTQNDAYKNYTQPHQQQYQNQTVQPQHPTSIQSSVQNSVASQNTASLSSANSNLYQHTQASGEFIQNIYKNQLQYPKVQSPISQYPTVSTPLSMNQYTYMQQGNNTQLPVSSSSNSLSNQTVDQIQNNQQLPQSSYANTFQQATVNYAQQPQQQQQQQQQTIQNYQFGQQQQNYAAYNNNNNNNNYAQPQSNIQNMTPQQPIQNTTIPATTTTTNTTTPTAVNNNVQEQKPPSTPVKTVKSANMDLLSGVDFSVSSIDNIPTLTPISIASKKEEEEKAEVKESPKKVAIDNVAISSIVQSPIKMNPDLADLDFSSLNVSTVALQAPVQVDNSTKKFEDPFENVNVLKQFHKEVESLEKYMETLTIKTLSGITPLANKWKELQDLLVKDESTRSISVAKLFPDKNRQNDFLPYDHGRVQLPTETDNYINAVYVKNCAPVQFIMAQMPMDNTINDWWEMVLSQKSNILVCLHSNNELLDPFWPQNINEEKSYGEICVTLLKQFELSHCFEKQLKVTRNGSDVASIISLLQVKAWKKRSADHIIDVSNNIITSFKQLNPSEKQYTPIILNCISGGTERSGLVTLGVSAILATQMRKPILLNIVDHWYRVCSQRKGVLDDESYLQLSLQVVLNNAHRILNKHGIMTTYQVKNVEHLSSLNETEKTVKDSLQELDPFWKFK